MISFSGLLPLKAALLLNPTFPELCVRSVDTQVTEAALEDMLDSILGARALIQRLHRLLLRQTNRKRAKLLPLMLWSLLVSGLFSRSDFPLMVLATLYNHCLSLSRPTLALTSKQQVSNQCPQQGKKNTADWHFLVMPVSHRLREWTGDELVENSSTTSTFSFLKSAGDTTFMWLTSKLEITYKRTTSYLSLFSPKSSKCVTLK